MPWEIRDAFVSALIGDVKVPASILIEQGFIEEVKETPKPRWKVGDKVVREYQTYSPDYLFIYRITLNSSNVWIYNEELTEKDLRDPTLEEQFTYFRFTYWYI